MILISACSLLFEEQAQEMATAIGVYAPAQNEGNFNPTPTNHYWSSSEILGSVTPGESAWVKHINLTNSPTNNFGSNKDLLHFVRAIRAF